MESSKSSGELVRDEKGRLLPGQESLNPNGRPVGKTMKEYVAEKFRTMTDEEKEVWLEEHKVSADLKWRMAEGNPQSDVMSGGEKIEPIQIYAGKSLHGHNSDSTDILPNKED